MTPPADDGLGSRDRIDTDRETAEVFESAGVQNVVAVAGPAALLLVPLAWALTAIRKALRRR